MNLTGSILSHPQRAFVPGKSGGAAAWRWDGGKDAPRIRIDLVDLLLGDLEQVPAIKGSAGVSGEIDRAQCLARSGAGAGPR